MSIKLADEPALAPEVGSPSRRTAAIGLPALIVTALTLGGLAIRAVIAHQSIFADELSTYWISATHSLGGVVSLMYGTPHIPHAEITPPLYFLAAWVTTQFGHSVELLRLPSLIAGTLTIPLVYLLARRMAGRWAALLAAALTTLSPFMIYYSAEARAYGVMMALTIGSTLSMLLAVDTGRMRWWVSYAICSCAAIYTHYTCAFVLAVQFLWLVWIHPEARRPALLANLGAVAGLAPWVPGLVQDLTSPTVNILSALSPFNLTEVRTILAHWSVGYPYTNAGSVTDLPGTAALILLAVSAVLVAAGLAPQLAGARVRQRIAAFDRRLLLAILLALAVPVGEAIVSATGNHIFGVRNLAASWPFLAVSGAALAARAGRIAGVAAAACAIAAFAIGAGTMFSSRFSRPNYQAAADYVAAHARPGDVVLDETGALSPGPLTALDTSLHRKLPVVRGDAPAERGHPYGFSDPIVSTRAGIRTAVARAQGHRVFLVTNYFRTNIAQLARKVAEQAAAFPAPYRLVGSRSWPGIGGTQVKVYAAQ
jgi:4-amino-4-deoxy-L-arabinose transferase-like glycosyltransferase